MFEGFRGAVIYTILMVSLSIALGIICHIIYKNHYPDDSVVTYKSEADTCYECPDEKAFYFSVEDVNDHIDQDRCGNDESLTPDNYTSWSICTEKDRCLELLDKRCIPGFTETQYEPQDLGFSL